MTIGTPLASTREERYAQARARLIPSRSAAVEAGYPNPHNAARLERRRRIQERIRELRIHDEIDLAWQRRLLREELTKVALFQIPSLFVENENGERALRRMAEWSEDERAAIAELWTDKDGIDRVKGHSKLTAIDLLMKLDGLAEPDTLNLNLNKNDASDWTREELVAMLQSPKA